MPVSSIPPTSLICQPALDQWGQGDTVPQGDILIWLLRASEAGEDK